jgi:hypothetical protein
MADNNDDEQTVSELTLPECSEDAPMITQATVQCSSGYDFLKNLIDGYWHKVNACWTTASVTANDGDPSTSFLNPLSWVVGIGLYTLASALAALYIPACSFAGVCIDIVRMVNNPAKHLASLMICVAAILVTCVWYAGKFICYAVVMAFVLAFAMIVLGWIISNHVISTGMDCMCGGFSHLEREATRVG